MLVASIEIYKVNRKRKREYTPYEVSKEEVKEYQRRDQSQWIMKEVMIKMEDRRWKKMIKKNLKKNLEK